jgi:hypothetical protein
MVYFSNGQITILNMGCKDAQTITDAEIVAQRVLKILDRYRSNAIMLL